MCNLGPAQNMFICLTAAHVTDMLLCFSAFALSAHTLPMQIISKSRPTSYRLPNENLMSFSNSLTTPYQANDQMVWWRIPNSSIFSWLKSHAQMTPQILFCKHTLKRCESMTNHVMRSEWHSLNTWWSNTRAELVLKDSSTNNIGDRNSRSSEWIRMSRTIQYRNVSQRKLEAHTR